MVYVILKRVEKPLKASAGEALDAIVSLANKSSSGDKNEALQNCLLDAVKNQNVPLQVSVRITSF